MSSLHNYNSEKEGCLVTGVAGFVGSHLAERLLGLGYSVIGVDNFFSGSRQNMASFYDHPSFVFHERSITEIGLIRELKAGHAHLRYCFHLAGIVSVPYSLRYPQETMEVNFHATTTLFKEAMEREFKCFVFAGSAAEYGDQQQLPILEHYASEGTNHLSPYGHSKFLASKWISSHPRGIALRFFNIYGPRQDPNSPYSGVISRFIDMANSGKPLTIFGDGTQTRDFIFVSDAVEAYLSAAGLKGKAPAIGGRIYNVAGGQSYSVLELAETVGKITPTQSSLIFLPSRLGDIRHSLASIDAFRQATSWNPCIPFHTGLKITLDWVSKCEPRSD